MARVTVAEVQEIIDLDSSITSVRITVQINAANLIVTNKLAGLSSPPDADTLKEIEKNLAAHLLCNLDPRITEEKVEQISVKYSGQFGKFLESTMYGQTALMLDHTGTLASDTGKRRASLGVIDYSVTD